jgi:sec-independent protein translocase protein TatA
MQMGPWQILIIAVVVLALFGRGKISALMGEVGKGITAFKRGVGDATAEANAQQQVADQQPRDVTPADRDKV